MKAKLVLVLVLVFAAAVAQYGIQVDIPPVAKTPDGAVVRNLMTMWSRIIEPR